MTVLLSAWRETAFVAKSRCIWRDKEKSKKARRRSPSATTRTFFDFDEGAADASRLQQKWVSRQALLILLTILATPSRGADLAQRFFALPQDYLPSGPHSKISANWVNSECFGDITQLSRQPLRHCLGQLQKAATKTYGVQTDYWESGIDKLLSAFAETSAPSDWDIHSPLLKVLLDRASGDSQRSEVVNPGLWAGCALQSSAVAEELLKRSKGNNNVSINALNDVINSGNNYPRQMLRPDGNERPDASQFSRLYELALVKARAVTARLLSLYGSHSSRVRGHNFLIPLSSQHPDALGNGLKVTTIPKCLVRINLWEGDIPFFPTLGLVPSAALVNNMLRRLIDPAVLAAIDLFPEEGTIGICYDALGFTEESTSRISGDDREHHEQITGRFFIVFRITYRDEMVGRIRVASDELRPYLTRFRKFDDRGRLEITWTAVTHSVRAYPSATLANKWDGELLKKLFSSHYTHAATPDESRHMELVLTPIRNRVNTERERLKSLLHTEALDAIEKLPEAAEWEGISKAMRTLALITAPDSFARDQRFQDAVLARGGPIVDRSSVKKSIADVLESLFKEGGRDAVLLTRPLTELNKLVSEKTAPELPSQRLALITQTTQTLLTTRERIRQATPGTNIEQALFNLRTDLKKFGEAGR